MDQSSSSELEGQVSTRFGTNFTDFNYWWLRFQSALLSGIFDEEMMRLQSEYEMVSMQNAVNFHYAECKCSADLQFGQFLRIS